MPPANDRGQRRNNKSSSSSRRTEQGQQWNQQSHVLRIHYRPCDALLHDGNNQSGLNRQQTADTTAAFKEGKLCPHPAQLELRYPTRGHEFNPKGNEPCQGPELFGRATSQARGYAFFLWVTASYHLQLPPGGLGRGLEGCPSNPRFSPGRRWVS